MNRSKILPWLSFCLFTALGLAWGLWMLFKPAPQFGASEPVAKVTELQGQAYRRAFLTSFWQRLELNSKIYHRDEVKTEKKSRLKIILLEDEQVLSFSEKALVGIERRALSILGGSVENESSGGANPFAISVGDVKVVMETREAELVGSREGGAAQALLMSKYKEVQTFLNPSQKATWAPRIESVNEQTQAETLDEWWLALDNILKASLSQRQNVKISRDEKSGAVRAQVAEGSVSLEVTGQVGLVDVHEGEGLMIDEASSEVKRVKLLPPVKNLSPQDKTLYNLESLTCRWSALKGADQYRVEFSDRDDFSNILASQSVAKNECIQEVKTWRGEYFWRVWGVDVNGFEGAKAQGRVELLEDRTPPMLKVDDINL